MNIELNFSNCSSFELLNIYDSVLNELLNRLKLSKNCRYIYRAKNGNIYPCRCEQCNGPVTMICNKLNLTQLEVEAVKNSSEFGEPFERWYNFIRTLIKEGKFQMPPDYALYPIEVNNPGEWYCAYCSCRIGDWKKTYEEAIESWWRRKILKLESKLDGLS